MVSTTITSTPTSKSYSMHQRDFPSLFVDRVTQKVIQGVYPGITTSELDVGLDQYSEKAAVILK